MIALNGNNTLWLGRYKVRLINVCAIQSQWHNHLYNINGQWKGNRPKQYAAAYALRDYIPLLLNCSRQIIRSVTVTTCSVNSSSTNTTACHYNTTYRTTHYIFLHSALYTGENQLIARRSACCYRLQVHDNTALQPVDLPRHQQYVSYPRQQRRYDDTQNTAMCQVYQHSATDTTQKLRVIRK